MGVSLKPSEASSGGAIIDDVDVTIKQCRFRLWDYNGTIPSPVLGLAVLFVDDEGMEAEQVFSAGEPKFFVPSEDGSEAVQVGTHPTLNENTNAMAFMASLVNAGFPEDKIADKVTVFEGTRCHVKQAPQPKRTGMKNQTPGQATKTVLLVSQIHTLPWQQPAQGTKAGAPKQAGVANKAAAPKQAGPVQAQAPAGAVQVAPAATVSGGNGEAQALETQAVQAMIGILASKGGTIQKSQIAQEAFKVLSNHPDRNALVQLVYTDAFLKSGPWSFDGTTVSFGG